ncbi:hypothetical protein [Streptomyces zagrosensis]|uniref:Uncharacterized protein n=1 Tax=Streptomyces zagrosensis TaxID=1042984 RepID=A0A7W9Q3U9_9ACTN|nr:hypothetical protein [Streptomyces zagrosensis]MBB5933128.1 hypothetical protein [Streptomyces zagrosensis]
MPQVHADNQVKPTHAEYEALYPDADCGTVTHAVYRAEQGFEVTTLPAFLPAANACTHATGHTLHHFGAEQAELGTDHAIGADDIDRELSPVTPTGNQPGDAVAMADRLFALFTAMPHEQLAFVEASCS